MRRVFPSTYRSHHAFVRPQRDKLASAFQEAIPYVILLGVRANPGHRLRLHMNRPRRKIVEEIKLIIQRVQGQQEIGLHAEWRVLHANDILLRRNANLLDRQCGFRMVTKTDSSRELLNSRLAALKAEVADVPVQHIVSRCQACR